MEIRPLYDRILVQRVEEEKRTASGLFLPEKAGEQPPEGTVLAVGQGRLADDGEIKPLAVKVGDRIAFGKYAGTKVRVDGEERLVLREDEVLGIID
jgi:chaperonin GroES